MDTQERRFRAAYSHSRSHFGAPETGLQKSFPPALDVKGTFSPDIWKSHQHQPAPQVIIEKLAKLHL